MILQRARACIVRPALAGVGGNGRFRGGLGQGDAGYRLILAHFILQQIQDERKVLKSSGTRRQSHQTRQIGSEATFPDVSRLGRNYIAN